MKRIAIISSSCSGKTVIEFDRTHDVDQWVESLAFSAAIPVAREPHD